MVLRTVGEVQAMSRARNCAGLSTQADFAVCMFVFLMIALFPLIDLLAVAVGAATVAFSATQAAARAASATNFPDAVEAAMSENYGITYGGLGRFARLSPQGGLGGTGIDLYVHASNINNGQVKIYGPNAAVSDPIDSTANVYEYCARASFDVGPLVNLSFVPFVNQIPGVGRPFRLGYSAFRAAEFSDGLSGTGSATSPWGGSAGGSYLISYAPQTNQGDASSTGGSTSNPGGDSGSGGNSGGWGTPPDTPPSPGDWWYGRGPWSWQKN